MYSTDQLRAWVEYALSRNAVILFDSAYEFFVQDASLPRSIFQIAGALRCAVEFCSLCKTAGITGVRCGYTVIPREVCLDGVSLLSLWRRRQSMKTNGVSYITQRGAEVVFTPEGLADARKTVGYYLQNTHLIAETLRELDIRFYGGYNSPYIFMQCPRDMTSWEFFDELLKKTGIVGTPGSGFGQSGEGFFRLTGFASREDTENAMLRLREYLHSR